MRYFAGIDGGQSSTTAVIGDELGRICGRGTAGPADEVNQGPRSTRLHDALCAAVGGALDDAKLPRGTALSNVVAGISGYDGTVYGKPPQLGAGQLTLLHDAPVAHAGALGNTAGVVVIAGTGSVAYAKNEAGSEALAGGWGYVFGDEGSAFWIARCALQAAFGDADAGEPGEMAQLALQTFGAPTLRALVRSFYTGGISRAGIASFATAIVRAAEGGDAFAAQTVRDAARALVMLAMRAMERTGLQNGCAAFTGGLMNSATIRDEIAQHMRALLPAAQLVTPRYGAPEGALLLAYARAGLSIEVLK
ncbi:MAG: BadF/BadG/BcrA/BcrD ATPase family protein [Candidatus Baltobacteraceae bacterium]